MTTNEKKAAEMLRNYKEQFEEKMNTLAEKAIFADEIQEVAGLGFGFGYIAEDNKEIILLKNKGLNFAQGVSGIFVPLDEELVQKYKQFKANKKNLTNEYCDGMEKKIAENGGETTGFSIVDFGELKTSEIRTEMIERGYAEIHGNQGKVFFRDPHSVKEFMEQMLKKEEEERNFQVRFQNMESCADVTRTPVKKKEKNFLQKLFSFLF